MKPASFAFACIASASASLCGAQSARVLPPPPPPAAQARHGRAGAAGSRAGLRQPVGNGCRSARRRCAAVALAGRSRPARRRPAAAPVDGERAADGLARGRNRRGGRRVAGAALRGRTHRGARRAALPRIARRRLPAAGAPVACAVRRGRSARRLGAPRRRQRRSVAVARRPRAAAREAELAANVVEEAAAAPRFDDYWSQGAARWWDYLRALDVGIDPAAKAKAAANYASARELAWAPPLRALCAEPGQRAEAMRKACASLGQALMARGASFALRRAGARIAEINAADAAARAAAQARMRGYSR